MRDRNALIGTIVGCTVTLLVAIGGMWVSMNSKIDGVEHRLRTELGGEMRSLDIDLSSRIDRLVDEVSELNERVSRIEGFLQRELEFLRGSDDE